MNKAGSHYRPITSQEFKRLYPNDGVFFLKGIRREFLDSKCAFFDTFSFDRQSKEKRKNYHFYDLVINDSTAWSQYPKRRNSLIGTTSLEVAKSYNFDDFGPNVYVVIPLTKKLVVCPTDDIMGSFCNSTTRALDNGEYSNYLKQFNQEVLDFLNHLNLSENEIRNLSFTSLISYLSEIPEDYFDNRTPTINRIKSLSLDCEKFLNEIFSPEINGFKITENPLSIIEFGKGNEVYAQGDILLYRFEDMIKEDYQISLGF